MVLCYVTAFVLVILRLFKLKTEGQTIHRKPHYKVTKLNSRLTRPMSSALGLAKSIY